jgi:hypothetical protein
VLTSWYRRDVNHDPPEFVLHTVTKEDEEKFIVWEEEERRMRRQFDLVAEKGQKSGKLSKEFAHSIKRSGAFLTIYFLALHVL